MTSTETGSTRSASVATGSQPYSRSAEGNGWKHEVICEALTQRIRTSMRPHDALPSERELMGEFEVSRMTVRRALATLEARGLVYRLPGSGTYVREDFLVSKTLRLTSFSEDMRERGLEPSSRVLDAHVAVAHQVDGAALRLNLRPADEVFVLRRLRLAQEQPMCLETLLMPHSVVPGIAGLDLSGSLYALMQERYGVQVARAQQRVRSVPLNEEEATLLAVQAGFPALRLDRVGVDQRGVPVEAAVTIYRGDRYEFDLTISRD